MPHVAHSVLSQKEAVAQVFLTAFKALPSQTQSQVIVGLMHDRKLREDLIDLAIAESRTGEPSRPLREFLSEIKSENLP